MAINPQITNTSQKSTNPYRKSYQKQTNIMKNSYKRNATIYTSLYFVSHCRSPKISPKILHRLAGAPSPFGLYRTILHKPQLPSILSHHRSPPSILSIVARHRRFSPTVARHRSHKISLIQMRALDSSTVDLRIPTLSYHVSNFKFTYSKLNFSLP